MNTTKLDLKHKPLLVAHRGCSGLERENTGAAFIAAGNRSYWGIETDIHRTGDGNFILIHDADTQRVANDRILVEESTLDTLRQITLCNKYTGEKDRRGLCLPTLAEYIAICKHYEKHAVLELKSSFSEQELDRIVCEIAAADYLDHTTFISFHYETLVLLRANHPDVSAQFLIGKELPENWLELLCAQKLDLDVYYKNLTKDMVRICHKNGIKVNCWTVDDPAVAVQLAKWGVDQITTNILE
ncbi:MAG: hypothetical protein IJA78_06360 [Clostridia bacterium]|nr:hypothetical protein [Clostridia bacterium]MBQ3483779.1 hypothetical protein [Clostridia bacterium]